MQTQWDLTAAEARAVTNLWRLRHQLPLEFHSAIGTAELCALLGAKPEELQKLGRVARRILPSSLVADEARLSWLEAETLLAIHASKGATGCERLPLGAVAGVLGVDEESLYPIVRDARERLAAAEAITRGPQSLPRYLDGFGVAVGENPYSWQIVWTVLILLTVGLAFLLWHYR